MFLPVKCWLILLALLQYIIPIKPKLYQLAGDRHGFGKVAIYLAKQRDTDEQYLT